MGCGGEGDRLPAELLIETWNHVLSAARKRIAGRLGKNR
jgi:hypothetical protein